VEPARAPLAVIRERAMTKRRSAGHVAKIARAAQVRALARPELLLPSTPRQAADSPTSAPIKTEDPAVRAMIDKALRARGRGQAPLPTARRK
jgi:hypothetical protein